MASSVQSVAAFTKDEEMVPVSREVLPELPAMGWTVEEEHLTKADVCMHHRLVGVLVNYYEDWEDVWVQYICLRRTHPLEATRWKSTVGVFIGNKLETRYGYYGFRATKEDSLNDAAYLAWTDLRKRRQKDMIQDNDRYLPYFDKDAGFKMLEPEGEDPVVKQSVRFIHDMMEKNRRLEELVAKRDHENRRLESQLDDLRVQLGQARIYDQLEPLPRK